MSKPTYSQAEINEIIRRALDKQSEREGHLDHDDLVAIADEVGIDRESLERATAELAQTRDSRLSRQDEATEIVEERKIQLKRFGTTLLSHAIMNGVFYYIDTRFFAGAWFKWPLLGSAILLTFRLRNVLAPYDKLLSRRRKAERRREKEQRRAARAAWKQRLITEWKPPSDHAKEFEKVVQSGVAALLEIASRKLDEHAKSRQRHDKE
jgi:uncharacterized membrane protein